MTARGHYTGGLKTLTLRLGIAQNTIRSQQVRGGYATGDSQLSSTNKVAGGSGIRNSDLTLIISEHRRSKSQMK